MVGVMYALRGAVSVAANDSEAIESAAAELVQALLARNQLDTSAIVSALFTVTPDLNAAFPAAGARRAGFEAVPMLCAVEIGVPGAPERIVRLMLHVEGSAPASREHVYLGEAERLRPDLVRPAAREHS